MKRYIILALTLLLAAVASAACYGNLDVNQNDKFACQKNEDCLQGYECRANHLCHEKDLSASIGGNCIDNDKDGFCAQGADDAGVRKSGACLGAGHCDVNKDIDCDDSDPSVHPGAAEICDGKDNDCNNTKDDVPLPDTISCSNAIECFKKLEPTGTAYDPNDSNASSPNNVECNTSGKCVFKSGYMCECGRIQKSGTSCS